MTVLHLNPAGLARPAGYIQVAVGTGNRLVSVSGQVAIDAQGRLVGHGDLASQTEQALVNVHTALAAAGATFADVIKMTIYVVDWDETKQALLVAGAARAATRTGAALTTTSTLVPVARGYLPEYMVEIDVLAVAANR
jgi:enamine deaminase RidA (YjgF/YER057c/UK114 family)